MTEPALSPSLLAVWRFLRHDLTETQFEALIYENDALEQLLGPELYLAVISTIYHDPEEVTAIRRRLTAFARTATPARCECLTLADLATVDMSSDCKVFSWLECVADRGSPRWWVSAHQCRECGQGWLVGEESRQNDLYCLRRLTALELQACRSGDGWLPDFDAYETLLRIGADSGRSVRWVDPIHSSSLAATMADVARARPGIAVSELAKLLALDVLTTRTLAESVVREHAVAINLETPGSLTLD